MKDFKREQSKAYKSYVTTSAVGLEVGISIVVAATLGHFFDKEFQTEPWGLLFGFAVGILAAVKALMRFSKKYLRESKEQEEEQGQEAEK